MIAKLAGTELYYEQHGEQGSPVLLLHGWGGNVDSFLPLIRDLSAHRRVFAVDFPGFRHSPEPPEVWGVPEYMEQIAMLIRYLQIEGTDIVAHSFGGRVTLALAATHPELVGRLVLTGVPGLKPDTPPKVTLKRRAYKLLSGLVHSGAARALLGEKRRNAMIEGLIQTFGSADYRELTPSMRPTFNRVIGLDLTPYLAKVRASTLLVWGEKDTAAPLWMAQKMEALIPDAGLVVYPGAGHFAYLEKLPEFTRVVRNFLGIDRS